MWTLQNGLGSTIDIDWIEEGFQSTIELAGHKHISESGLVTFFDDGAQYDKVRSVFSAVINQTKMTELENFYNADRDGDFTLITNSQEGLALFSPAFGDEGAFVFKIKSMKQTGALNKEIYKYFRVEFSVLAVGFPTYSPSLGNDEGKIQIGTIGGLRYPVNDFDVSIEMDVGAEQTGFGVAYVNDWEEQNEKTKFTLRLLHDKMSLLLKNLRTTRYSDLLLNVPSGVYPFGAKQGNFLSFQTRLLNTKLIVNQIKNKRYELTLELQRLSSE